jgi:hypothetical protein
MSLILSFDTARGVNVFVDGVDDQVLVGHITAVVRSTFRHMVGKWSIGIMPGSQRGEWRMRLRGSFGVHIWSFMARRESLPDVAGEKLALFLWRCATDRAQTRSPSDGSMPRG